MATEHFFQHTSVSGKTPLPPSFFDAWLFQNYPDLLNNCRSYCKPIVMTTNKGLVFNMIELMFGKNVKYCHILNGGKQITSEFENCTDLSSYQIQFTTPNQHSLNPPVNIPPDFQEKILSKQKLLNTSNDCFSRYTTIKFPTTFISEPHVSYFITPMKDSNIKIEIDTITCDTVIFRVDFRMFSATTYKISENPHPDTCIHWHAVGAYAPPTTNLLD
jgi:hypothetical protein